jgi:hypothetical protein
MSSVLLTLFQIAVTPMVWIVLLFWWAWRRFDVGVRVLVEKTFHRPTAQAGRLYADGSTATSKTEMLVRSSLVQSGLRPARAGTALWTNPDHRGIPHKYTPDILVPAAKLIIEVDPNYTHGQYAKTATPAGDVFAPTLYKKVADDLLRNQMYAALDYRVVRLRMGGAQALSPHDVVVESGYYDPASMTPVLIKACRKAKWLPPTHWESARQEAERMAHHQVA